jgi:hypothetical protein
MSAVLAFNCGAASRQDVMKAASIPGGEFTLEGCKKKDATRMRHSVKKAKLKKKEGGKSEKPSLQQTKRKVNTHMPVGSSTMLTLLIS